MDSKKLHAIDHDPNSDLRKAARAYAYSLGFDGDVNEAAACLGYIRGYEAAFVVVAEVPQVLLEIAMRRSCPFGIGDQLRAIVNAHWHRPSPPQGAQSVPDGWKLVPVEPTREMVIAGSQASEYHYPDRIWDAMLAIAPEPAK